MPERVFISYSSLEGDSARRVCQAIEDHDIACWMAPRDIPAGADWAATITQAIRRAPAMIVLMSRKAEQSSQIGRELGLASNGGKLLIPVRIESFPLSSDDFAYHLSGRHWVDLYDDWVGGVAKIIDVLRGNAQPSQSTGVARPVGPARSIRRWSARWVAVALLASVAAVGLAEMTGIIRVRALIESARSSSTDQLKSWLYPNGALSQTRNMAIRSWINHASSVDMSVAMFLYGAEYEPLRRRALAEATLMQTPP